MREEPDGSLPRFDEALSLEMYVEGSPVSVNHMYGVARGRRQKRFLTEPARIWQQSVFAETQVALILAGQTSADPAVLRTPLKVACVFFGCRADADNLLKLTLDGLKEGLGIDDRHFAVVESGKAPAFVRNGRRFRGCWIGVWESAAADGGAAAHASDSDAREGGAA